MRLARRKRKAKKPRTKIPKIRTVRKRTKQRNPNKKTLRNLECRTSDKTHAASCQSYYAPYANFVSSRVIEL